IPHPFKKFSFAAIPDFQFGGMEHPGAIWYNANILFLDSSATRTQLIRRANLIAHETSHMWFGDLVTMRWFDDVWMKEVFANFMADKIVGIILPDDNIDIKFVVDHFPLSYSIDRTKGANPIRQELENLQEAGTLYGHIIYHKAPIMMLQLERLIGEQALQSGLQEYLKTYSFDNASWPDLITILDTNTPEDLQSWNDNWVNKAGRPTYTRMITDPKGDNYGLFDVDTTKIAELYKITDPVLRAFQYINLYENMLEGRFIDPNTFVTVTLTALDYEKEELLIQQLLSQLGVAYWNFISADQRAARAGELESKLWTLMEQANKNNLKKMFFKSYTGIAQSDAATTKIYSLWKNKTAPSGVNLTDDEYADLATWLAIRNHPQSREILNEQLTRIDNTDKKQRWEFWMPALSPDEKERDAFFESLKNANNRRKESWVNTALSYLHHPLRRESAEKYIRPSLELLPEIQKTGDIFFPQNWLQAILTYHNSENAAQTVQQFIDENPDFSKRLLNKLLQGADMLFRANRKSTN
ncbi:MAG TPA: M1 family aminopeptidase, partial [Parasegetibacter sp.]